MIEVPDSLESIRQLIDDAVPESLHLDYKRGDACAAGKSVEISKDVSALANSDGGVIIYGIAEAAHAPTHIEGVRNNSMTRERLEQIINSNIAPRIDGLLIQPIVCEDDETTIYVVSVSQSFRAPHQAKDHKYYKRFNFQSIPMEDYEIRDVRGRQSRLLPLVNVDLAAPSGDVLFLKVEHIGEFPALDVTFEFSREPSWIPRGDTPPVFSRGIRYFPPRRSMQFRFGRLRSFVGVDPTAPTDYSVTVTYTHPVSGSRVSDQFHFDVADFLGTQLPSSDVAKLESSLKSGLSEIGHQLRDVQSKLQPLAYLVSGTGLRVSIPTLEAVRRTITGLPVAKVPAHACSEEFLVDAFGLDFELACDIADWMRGSAPAQTLRDVRGVTDELVRRLVELVDVPGEAALSPALNPIPDAVESELNRPTSLHPAPEVHAPGATDEQKVK